MRHDLQHLSSMSVFSYSRKLSWRLYFLLALLQSSQGISGYGTLIWCRRMVSSHHSVVFQTAAYDRLCYPGKTRRGYYQEPTLKVIKALTLKLLTRLGYGAPYEARTHNVCLEGRNITVTLMVHYSAFTVRP